MLDWGEHDVFDEDTGEWEKKKKPNPQPRNPQDWSRERHVLRKILKEVSRNAAMANDHDYQAVDGNWKKAQIPQLLSLLVRDSPKIAALMLNIADEVVKRKEKAIVWTLYPDEQLILREIMSYFGIDARILSSDLSSTDHVSLTRSFNEPGGTQVLLASYTTNCAGLNLQKECRNVHLLDPATNANTEKQAIGRCYRLGQQQEVRVTGYYTRGTFNSYMFAHQIEKLLPGLAAMVERSQLGEEVSSETLLADGTDLFTWIDPHDNEHAPFFVRGQVDPSIYPNTYIIEEIALERALVKVAKMLKGKSTLHSGGFGPEFGEWCDYVHLDTAGNVRSDLGMDLQGRTQRKPRTPKTPKKR
jgi:hypothetical protein